MTILEFALPDVGEGLTEAEIVRWRIGVGDEVVINQPIVDIETAKAVVELPSPFAGTVTGLLAGEGAVVPVGTAILAVEVSDRGTQAGGPGRSAGDPEPVLVGYGVAREGTRRRRLRSATPQAPEAAVAPVAQGHPRAKPPVRALARSMGIDLATVTPTGPHGDVTRADLRGAQSSPAAQGGDLPSLAVSARRGEVIPVRGVRRAMAEAMVRSVEQAPHVTEWVDVDVSRTVALIDRMRANEEFSAVRVTPLTVTIAALVRAVRRTPIVNATWHDLPDGSAEIEVHRHVNVGIAVASPRGLVVPHVPGADRMSLRQLSEAITDVTDRARAGALTPADSVGGTITVTNVGVFGVDGGTPILNPGEAAILAMGRILDRPWVVNGGLAVRPVMELTLSFDHRIVDGAAGSTFLADVAAYLSDPVD